MSFLTEIHQAHKARRLAIAARAVADDGISLKIDFNRPRRGFRWIDDPPPMPAAKIELPSVPSEEASMVTEFATPAFQPMPRVKVVSNERVIRMASGLFGISVDELKGPKRFAKFVLPRQVVAYVCRETLCRSYPKISYSLGGRDHTTAMSAVKKISRKLHTDPDLAWYVAHLEAMVVDQLKDLTAPEAAV